MNLPSKFQVGEVVRCGGLKGPVKAVTFAEETDQDGMPYGKVYYDVLTERGLRQRVPSEKIWPEVP